MDNLSELTERVIQVLKQADGVCASTELQARLGLSQPTVSRALSALVKQGRLLKVGAARSQQYLLPRHIEGVGSQIGIVRVDTQGRVSPFARMVALPGGRFWVKEADGLTQLHDGLPWFLDDMRPQGFMGQTFVQNHPELSLPADLRHWNDEHALKAMVLAGDDLPGNLIVGEQALARYLSEVRQTAVVQQPEMDYPRLAERAMQARNRVHPQAVSSRNFPPWFKAMRCWSSFLRRAIRQVISAAAICWCASTWPCTPWRKLACLRRKRKS